MPRSPLLNLDIRSYGSVREPHRHDFAQLVLPLKGSLAMDIAGRRHQLDTLNAAFVQTGAMHSQISDAANRSIIVDLDLAALAPAIVDRLVARPYMPLAPIASRLVDYMGLVADGGSASGDRLDHWLPLLLDALVEAPARPQSRLAALMEQIEAEPGEAWTAEAMAGRIGLSVSRLHALFRSEHGTTPAAWLSELRIRRAREWLAATDEPIVELALRAGYSDQSALTRAMRRATGLTPAAYRRLRRKEG
jgi:AraC-like DNA-binding protein